MKYFSGYIFNECNEYIVSEKRKNLISKNLMLNITKIPFQGINNQAQISV